MNSKRPVAPKGYGDPSRELAVTGDVRPPSGTDGRRVLIVGLVWCLVSSTGIMVAPIFSCGAIAFGMVILMRVLGRMGDVISLLVPVGASCVGTSLVASVLDIPFAVVMAICSFVMAKLVESGRLRTGVLLVVAALAAAAMLGIDTVSTTMQGTSISQVIANVVNEVVESSADTLDLEATAALLRARDQVVVLWPAIYFVCGLGMALCALAGSALGLRAAGAPVAAGAASRYDVPLAVVVLLAVGIAAQLLGPRLPLWADEVTICGANAVLCARLCLAQQGLSVLLWWVRERRVNVLPKVLAILAGVWLEMSFALASAVGLIDTMVNFRHLERKRPDLVAWPTQQR